jgi:hypothetical protein
MPRQNNKRKGFGGTAKPEAAPAKAKSKRAWDGNDFSKSAASFFDDQLTSAEAKNGGILVGSESERAVIGVPLKAFSLQFLHSSDTYPLGRMEMLIGESESNKTAYLFEKQRWFLREPGGGAVYLLNEARDPSDLRRSIMGDLVDKGGFRLEGPCASLEDWQRRTTGLLHRFEGAFKMQGGVAFPIILGLDSITGTTNERVIKDIDEKGCAQLTFGQDANLLNQYSKFLFQRLYKWPIAFVTTSHIKYGTDRYNNKVMRIPGGDSLRYVSTYICLLKKLKDIDRLDVSGGRRISLKMIKCMGEHREIQVDFVWTYEHKRQNSVWNWHGATTELLAGFSGERGKAISAIINFPDWNKTSQTCKCPELGIKKAAPWDEVGAALMQSPKVLGALQDYFGIKRRRPFEAGVPYNEQIARAIAEGQVEGHDMGDVSEGVGDPDEDVADGMESEIPVDEE